MEIKSYIHRAKYYETDKMGIVHHSNYIRWMEEARIDFLDQIGFSFSSLEDSGIVSPTIMINCSYKEPTKFDDEVEIKVRVKSYSGVKLIIEYEMNNLKTGNIVLTGESGHCFTNKEGFPIRLKNDYPEFDKKLKELS